MVHSVNRPLACEYAKHGCVEEHQQGPDKLLRQINKKNKK
jgi:hypothetical protein